MSTLIGLRPVSRSAKVGVGVKDLVSGKTTFVNLDNPRVARDLARHAAIGQSVVTQPAIYALNTATIERGGKVTPRDGSVTLDVSAATLRYNVGVDAVYTSTYSGQTASIVAGTRAVTPDSTNPLVAALGFDTSSPGSVAQATVITNTAASTVTREKFLSRYDKLATFPAIDSTANRTWIALVWVPPATGVTAVASTGVVTLSGHGLKVGEKVWFSDVTGSSAGISTATVYYVRSVPSANTFTLSATAGGSLLTWTGNLTSGATIQRQILSSDVVDIRP